MILSYVNPGSITVNISLGFGTLNSLSKVINNPK